MDGIEPYKWVYRFKWTSFLLFEQGDDLVRDGTDRSSGEAYPVDLLQMAPDLGVTVTQGTEREDLLLDLITHMGLMFLDDLGLEGSVTVSGNFQIEFTDTAFHPLGRSTVLTVSNLLG